MDFLTALIVLAIVGIPGLGVVWFLSEIFGSKPSQPAHRPVQDSDPDWEDHIRHDPYHPAGNQDYDTDYDYEDEEH